MVYSNTLNVPLFYGHTAKCVVGVGVTKTFSYFKGNQIFIAVGMGGARNVLKFLANILHPILVDTLWPLSNMVTQWIVKRKKTLHCVLCIVLI